MASWPALNRAYKNLQSARRREIVGNNFSFSVQFNPGRIASAEARIDQASLEKRPCFLCRHHLPQDQMAVLYRRSFVILCNPFPIFEPHFTIAHLDHRPQILEGSVSLFLQLARDFSPDFTVFYNGPRCGASAPDHLHFQGGPAGSIPIEKEALMGQWALIKTIKDVSVFAFRQPERQAILLEGEKRHALASVTSTILDILNRLAGGEEEAMVNIIASFRAGRWRVFIFPRSKHRPDAFFRKGDDRLAITPGAVEMGGLVITIHERDFRSLDHKQLVDIFTEVSAEGKIMKGVVDALLDYRR
jgi:hypothetical protein